MQSHEMGLAMQRQSLSFKVLRPDRLTILSFQAIIGLIAIFITLKEKRQDIRTMAMLGVGLIIAQFVLIIIDKAPFLYVYSYGLSGVLITLLAAINTPKAHRAFLITVMGLGALQSLHVLYPVGTYFGYGIHGAASQHKPINYDAKPLHRLTAISRRQAPLHINNQLNLDNAICKKLSGKSVSRFNMQVLCLENAVDIELYTIFLTHQHMTASDPAIKLLIDTINAQDTVLVSWGGKKLNPDISQFLETSQDWKLYKGFALRQKIE